MSLKLKQQRARKDARGLEESENSLQAPRRFMTRRVTLRRFPNMVTGQIRLGFVHVGGPCFFSMLPAIFVVQCANALNPP